MKVELDLLTSAAGWSGPAGSGFSVNQHGEYVAEYLGSSLIVHVPAGSAGRAFTKSIGPVDVSKCSEVVLSVWSRECRRVRVNKPADYFYTIQFDSGHQFMMPTNLGFESVSFGIDGWTSADRITITPTTDREDWLILSGCYALYDDLPLDLMQGMAAGLRRAVAAVAPGGVPIGTASCLAGDRSLVPSSFKHLDRGAVVTVSSGGNSETHQVDRFDESSVWFSDLFDGSSMLYDHSAASVSLEIPVRYGVLEEEAAVPAITVWGMASQDSQDTQDTFMVEDSMDPSGAAALRRTTWKQTYKVLIDCEARSHQLLALVSRCAKAFLASSRVWVNGRAHEMPYPESAVYVEPEESVVQIPKLQYEVSIEVREERAPRAWAPPVTGETLTYTPRQGILGSVEP